jgi:hypothetical protein
MITTTTCALTSTITIRTTNEGGGNKANVFYLFFILSISLWHYFVGGSYVAPMIEFRGQMVGVAF